MIADFWDVSWITMVFREVLPEYSAILSKRDYNASLLKFRHKEKGLKKRFDSISWGMFWVFLKKTLTASFFGALILYVLIILGYRSDNGENQPAATADSPAAKDSGAFGESPRETQEDAGGVGGKAIHVLREAFLCLSSGSAKEAWSVLLPFL